MLFIGLRVVLIVLLLVVAVWCFSKVFPSRYQAWRTTRHFSEQQVILFLLVYCWLMLSISIRIPFEQKIFTFNTPEAAFRYSFTTEPILEIIDTDTCTFIIFDPPGSRYPFDLACMQKSKGRWLFQTPIGLHSNQRINLSNRGWLYEFHSHDAKEILILIRLTALPDESVQTIADNQGNIYESFSAEIPLSTSVNRYYYLVLDELPTDYQLFIGDSTYSLQ